MRCGRVRGVCGACAGVQAPLHATCLALLQVHVRQLLGEVLALRRRHGEG